MSPNAGLLLELEHRGYAARVVPVERLADLRESIEAAYRDHLIDEGLWKEYLSGFAFAPPDSLEGARSVIVASSRQPPVRFTFSWEGKRVPAIVPPTYLHWRRTDGEVQACLEDILGREGYRVAAAVLPKKLLAVRSGLAVYGRNNITYVPGMGSFHRLAAFYSDMPCETDGWTGLRAMERCEVCRACLASCPADAIGDDRFLLRAERCITFHNEKPGQTPFPGWLDPAWHNCLVGCMRCQMVCPENRGQLLPAVDGADFSREETELLLAGTPRDGLPEALAEKLDRCDLADWVDILPRNLRALLQRA
jgi:epoxyqueuosine reductase